VEGGIRPRSRPHEDLSPLTVRGYARDVEWGMPGVDIAYQKLPKISHACCGNRNRG
jgi:hypothetical protein